MSPAADLAFMRLALAQAEEAGRAGEVPVGAVVVRHGQVIGRGHNRSISRQDVTAHAEIEAIRQASEALGNYRLDECDLYVTLEPCVMRSGAVLGARIRRLVFGATEPKTGAAGSVLNVFAEDRLNHHTQVAGGVLAPDCAATLQRFFQDRRQQQARHRVPLREDALRPDDAHLPAWPPGVRSVFVHDLPALQGLRLHTLQAGEGGQAVLLLHGPSHWSATYSHAADRLAAAGLAVLAPDLPGFGWSDKPKKAAWHGVAGHTEILKELLLAQPQTRWLLVAPPSLSVLAARLCQDAALSARQVSCVGIDEPALPSDLALLPYPDAGHLTGPRVLPGLLEQTPTLASGEARAPLHLGGADWPAQLLALMQAQS